MASSRSPHSELSGDELLLAHNIVVNTPNTFIEGNRVEYIASPDITHRDPNYSLNFPYSGLVQPTALSPVHGMNMPTSIYFRDLSGAHVTNHLYELETLIQNYTGLLYTGQTRIEIAPLDCSKEFVEVPKASWAFNLVRHTILFPGLVVIKVEYQSVEAAEKALEFFNDHFDANHKNGCAICAQLNIPMFIKLWDDVNGPFLPDRANPSDIWKIVDCLNKVCNTYMQADTRSQREELEVRLPQVLKRLEMVLDRVGFEKTSHIFSCLHTNALKISNRVQRDIDKSLSEILPPILENARLVQLYPGYSYDQHAYSEASAMSYTNEAFFDAFKLLLDKQTAWLYREDTSEYTDDEMMVDRMLHQRVVTMTQQYHRRLERGSIVYNPMFDEYVQILFKLYSPEDEYSPKVVEVGPLSAEVLAGVWSGSTVCRIPTSPTCTISTAGVRHLTTSTPMCQDLMHKSSLQPVMSMLPTQSSPYVKAVCSPTLGFSPPNRPFGAVNLQPVGLDIKIRPFSRTPPALSMTPRGASPTLSLPDLNKDNRKVKNEFKKSSTIVTKPVIAEIAKRTYAEVVSPPRAGIASKLLSDLSNRSSATRTTSQRSTPARLSPLRPSPSRPTPPRPSPSRPTPPRPTPSRPSPQPATAQQPSLMRSSLQQSSPLRPSPQQPSPPRPSPQQAPSPRPTPQRQPVVENKPLIEFSPQVRMSPSVKLLSTPTQKIVTPTSIPSPAQIRCAELEDELVIVKRKLDEYEEYKRKQEEDLLKKKQRKEKEEKQKKDAKQDALYKSQMDRCNADHDQADADRKQLRQQQRDSLNNDKARKKQLAADRKTAIELNRTISVDQQRQAAEDARTIGNAQARMGKMTVEELKLSQAKARDSARVIQGSSPLQNTPRLVQSHQVLKDNVKKTVGWVEKVPLPKQLESQVQESDETQGLGHRPTDNPSVQYTSILDQSFVHSTAGNDFSRPPPEIKSSGTPGGNLTSHTQYRPLGNPYGFTGHYGPIGTVSSCPSKPSNTHHGSTGPSGTQPRPSSDSPHRGPPGPPSNPPDGSPRSSVSGSPGPPDQPPSRYYGGPPGPPNSPSPSGNPGYSPYPHRHYEWSHQLERIEEIKIDIKTLDEYLEVFYRKVNLDDNWMNNKKYNSMFVIAQQESQLPHYSKILESVVKSNEILQKWSTNPETYRRSLSEYSGEDQVTADDIADIKIIRINVSGLCKDIKQWAKILFAVYTQKGLNHSKDRSGKVPPIKLSKFSGFGDFFNVFEFLEKFESCYGTSVPNPEEKARLLFENHLQDSIKSQLKIYEYDYDLLKKHLRAKFGDGEKIIQNMYAQAKLIKCKSSLFSDRADYCRLLHDKIVAIEAVITDIQRGDVKAKMRMELYSTGMLVKLQELPQDQLTDGQSVVRRWLNKYKFVEIDKETKIREKSFIQDEELLIVEDKDSDIRDGKKKIAKFLMFLEDTARYYDNMSNEITAGLKLGKGEKNIQNENKGAIPKKPKQVVNALKRKTKREKLKNTQVQKDDYPMEVNLLLNDFTFRILFSGNNFSDQAVQQYAILSTAANNDPIKFEIDSKGKATADYDTTESGGTYWARCMVCPNKGHEITDCKKGMSAGNAKRLEFATKRKICHFCLSRVCFNERMKKLFKDKSDLTVWDSCSNSSKQINCPVCVEEKKNRKNFMHILLCTHKIPTNDALEILGQHLKGYKKNIPAAFLMHPGARLQMYTPPCSDTDSEEDSNGIFREKLIQSLHLGEIKLSDYDDKKTKSWVTKNIHKRSSKAFDTSTGSAVDLKELASDCKIVRETRDSSIYFLQNAKIGNHTVLLFYDTGSNGGCILGELAQKWELQVIDPRPQIIIGAGNHVTHSQYGRYIVHLGPTVKGEYHEISMIGLESITGPMPKYDLSLAWNDVKKYDSENDNLIAGEVLPQELGGMGASILIGVNQSRLQPVPIFCHPCGLLVARTQLIDSYGSRLVIAGSHESFKFAEESQGFQKIFGWNCIMKMAAYKHPVFTELFISYKNSLYTGSKLTLNCDQDSNEDDESDGICDIINNDSFPLPMHGNAFENDEDLAANSPSDSIEEFLWLKQFEDSGLINSTDLGDRILTDNGDTTATNLSYIKGDLDCALQEEEKEYFTRVIKNVEEGLTAAHCKRSAKDSCASNGDLNTCDTKSMSPGARHFSKQSGLVANSLQHTCEDCTCYTDCDQAQEYKVMKLKKLVRAWEDENETGTLIDYRCPRCQSCPECRKSGKNRARSIREEDEQAVIESSIRIEYPKEGETFGKTFVKLPFIKDPLGLKDIWKNDSNYSQAYKVLQQQLRLDSEARAELQIFHNAIFERGFCQELNTLEPRLQLMISKAVLRHYYVWRGAWKLTSLTTPCRMVVDPLTTGLNMFLAKGVNTLNSLQKLLLDFRTNPIAATFDVAKMYNMLHIEEESLQYQLYLWVDELNPANPIKIMVFTRAMYGVVSTGNQAETAIRRSAARHADTCPLGASCVINSVYVDDGLPTANTMEEIMIIKKEIEFILSQCGFIIKVWTTVYDEVLSEKASSDGQTIGVCGMRWHPRLDLIGLAFGEMNFNKSVRGKKKQNPHKVENSSDIDDEILPKTLTRRHAVGKAAELFDITGLVECIKTRLKIDLAALVDRGLSWDDPIPQDLIRKWTDNFGVIQDTRAISWQRCIIPLDAINLKVRLLDIHDASKQLAVMGIYAGYKKKDDTWSCQLIFSRSTLSRLTIPRNELVSSVLGAQGLYIMKDVFDDRLEYAISVGDSSISLAWESNPDARLKQWAFTRVRQIHRLTENVPRFHCPSGENCVDIATRGLAKIEDISEDSEWIQGKEWMKLSMEDMKTTTLKTYEQVCSALTPDQKASISDEELPTLEKFSNKPSDEDLFYVDINSKIQQSRNYGKRVSIIVDDEIIIDMIPTYRITSTTIVNCSKLIKMSTKDSEQYEEIVEHDTGVTNSTVRFADCFPFPARALGSSMATKMANNLDLNLLIDPVHYGWRKSNVVIGICFKFVSILIHKTHLNPNSNIIGQNLLLKCKICVPTDIDVFINNGYLDRLHRRTPETVEFDNSARIDSPIPIGELEESQLANTFNNFQRTFAKKVKKKISSKDLKKELKEAGAEAKRIEERIGKKKSKMTRKNVVFLNDRNIRAAFYYFIKKVSDDVEARSTAKQKQKWRKTSLGIWVFAGRLAGRDKLTVNDMDSDLFFDFKEINFIVPVMLIDNPICYAFLMNMHWHVLPHRGVRTIERALDQVFHVPGSRRLITYLRKDCLHCKLLLGRTVDQEMSKLGGMQDTICPPFYSIQMDCMSPLFGYSAHNFRSVLKLWSLLIVCNVTGAASAWILEKENTESIVKALLRHSYRYGFPAFVWYDLHPAMIKSATLKHDLLNMELKLNRDLGMVTNEKSTQDHPAQGRVERLVRSMREGFSQEQVEKLRQSIISWETTLGATTNFLNNLPIARTPTSTKSDRGELDVLTKNKILMGRNNFRSLTGSFDVSGDPIKMLEKMKKINREFFRILFENIREFIPQPKWWKESGRDCEVNDLVMFRCVEGPLGEYWRLGIVYEQKAKNPGKWSVRYRNASEAVDRFTTRSSRELIIIHRVEDLDFNSEEHWWQFSSMSEYRSKNAH